MKKFLFIGDIHGRDDWKDITIQALTHFQEVIFLGDYVDSYTIKPVEILHNLKEIIEQKKKSGDKITLLLGNHDYAYINDHSGTSGFEWHVWQEYKEIFSKNRDLFQVAWGYTNPSTYKYTLATHAGLTKGYYDKYIRPKLDDPESKLNQLTDGDAGKDLLDPHEILNFMRDDEDLGKVGRMRGGYGIPGPLWADYLEFLEDRFEGINQVFGHTAAGVVNVNQFEDDLIAKVDGYGNKRLAHVLLNI